MSPGIDGNFMLRMLRSRLQGESEVSRVTVSPAASSVACKLDRSRPPLISNGSGLNRFFVEKSSGESVLPSPFPTALEPVLVLIIPFPSLTPTPFMLLFSSRLLGCMFYCIVGRCETLHKNYTEFGR